MTPRYAVYFTPAPDTPWWQAGSHWLGRCANTDAVLPQPALTGWSPAEQLLATAQPRRYGWHATLKAPFHLALAVSETDVCKAIASIAQAHKSVPLHGLVMQYVGDCLALTLDNPIDAVAAVASHCVQDLRPLSAPLTPVDIARRRRAELSLQQDAYMLQWGYPYVFEEFRLHITLSGPLTHHSAMQRENFKLGALQHFESLPPMTLDGLALFRESAPGDAFEYVARWPLSLP